ncbi:hypothetical protein KGQ71_03400, partial [Patescibacteria group bacterium]|nr:hypothetical protein [Patescibacteria group bacterium]
LFTAATVTFFVYFFHTHMLLPDGAGNLYTVGPTWGDIALHMSLVSFFSAQPHFSWTLPIYYSARLSYPFLIDLFSSFLYQGGLNMAYSLLLPGLLLLLAFLQAVFFLVWRWCKNGWTPVLGLLLFLMGGSYISPWYFWKGWQGSGLSLLGFLQTSMTNYNHYTPANLQYGNIILDFLMPQRSIILGFSLFVLVIFLFWQAYKSEERSREIRLLAVAAVITGFMPLAHFHTYVITSLVFSWLTIVRLYTKKKAGLPWLYALLFSLLPALPQVWWQITSVQGGQYGHFYLGWMREPGENGLWFWLRNMGPIFLFLVALPYLIRRYIADAWFFHFYFPLWVVFIICNIYIFHPNPYDNMKLFSFTYLAACLFLAYFLIVWVGRRWWKVALATMFYLTLILPGVVAISSEAAKSWLFLSQADVAFAARVRAVTPPDAVILTADQHDHPVSTLTGRKIVMGYRGWLWNFGIPYHGTESDIRSIYAGDPAAPALLEKYNISYVAIGPPELTSWTANVPYFEYHYPVVAATGQWELFKVR